MTDGNGIGRRDTLKLASTMAALGAGLGVLLDATRSDAAPTASPTPLPPPQPIPGPTPTLKPMPPPLETLKLDSAAQIKIQGYQSIKIERGFVQFKFYSGAGQFLYAANMPEEIARALTDGTVLQFKFFRGAADGSVVPTSYAEAKANALKVTPTK